MSLSHAARTLWAKTPGREAGADSEGQWLALAQHLRDSADVGERLAARWIAPSVRWRLKRVAGDSVDELVACLAGTHDLGKAQVLFQAQIASSPQHSWMWDQVRRLECAPVLPPDPRVERGHAWHSDVILRRWLRREFPEASPKSIASVTSVLGCHHGRPSDLNDDPDTGLDPRLEKLESWLDAHGEDWLGMCFELVDDIMARTGAHDVLGAVLHAGGLPVEDQLLLAGLVTVADWIASNQNLFPLTESGMHSDSRSRADGALDELSLTRAWKPGSPDTINVRARFRWPETAELRPSQEQILQLAQQVGPLPVMMIIEAETGEGKTESALLAAEVLASRTGAGGLAFALPTMATSDAMFSRVQDWVGSVSSDEGTLHTLFLGHSRAPLNRNYDELVRGIGSVDRGGGMDSEVIAHQWLRGRRRGLLAEFVVCTIDQILMCALATRYVTLRHLGLAGKVIVIDEVHAFDVYSSSYLQKALTWLGTHGAPVLLLSATLSAAQRESLQTAYANGLDAAAGVDAADEGGKLLGADLIASLMSAPLDEVPEPTKAHDQPPFPRVTVVARDGAEVHALTARDGHRRIRLQKVDDDENALLQSVEALEEDGGVVGIICNTVRRAQAAFESVRRRFGAENVELLHSQFTAGDRADREQALVAALGPDGHRDSGRPSLRIVVGTQVLEQSLDVDFDLLISDLAPIDALAQRAGRLHRHERPGTDRPLLLSEPRLIIRGVDTEPEVPVADPGSVAIYGERVLLATLAVLEPQWRGQEWCLRHEVADAVERTYGEGCPVPAHWEATYEQARTEESARHAAAEKKAGTFQLLDPSRSDGRMSKALRGLLDVDVDTSETMAQAHVRDIQPTLEVLLVQRTNAGFLRPLPWLSIGEMTGADVVLDEMQPPPDQIARTLAVSAVRLPSALVPPYENSFEAALNELEEQGIPGWQAHHLLKGQLVLTVDEELQGTLVGREFRYDRDIGLRVEPSVSRDNDKTQGKGPDDGRFRI